jgi:peptide/nickel transport system substrate-binding protein
MPTLTGRPATRFSALGRRRLLGAGLGLASLAAGLRPAAAAGVPGTVRVGLSAFPPNLRPWEYVGTAAETVKLQLFRGLLGYDAEGNLRPELAARIVPEGDRVYVVSLRPGARFHNGDPVTSADVKFSFEAIVAERSTAYLRREFAVIESIAAPDPLTVRITLREPDAVFPSLLASYDAPIVSRRSVEADPAAPVGAGPYVMKAMERGRRIDLEAFPGFYREGRPRTRNLVFLAYPDENLRTAALESGDLDLIEYVPAERMDAIERNPQLALDSVDGPCMILIFNVTRGPFQNPALRQAVAFAINRAEIVRAGFAGRGSPAGGLAIPPSSPFYDAENGRFWRYDPAEARRWLAQAGQPDGFATTILATTTYGMHQSVAEIVQQHLRAVGIRAELNLPEWASRIQLGNRGQYDVAVSASGGDSNDPDSLRTLLGMGQPPSFARPFGYENAQLLDLLNRGRHETDLARRREIYRRAERIGLEDPAFVALNWRPQAYAMQRAVQGFKTLPGNLHHHSGYRLEDVALV